jgi:hypothetical protein
VDAASGEEHGAACDLGLLAHLILTSKPIMRDASVRKAVIALLTAHIKSVISVADAETEAPAEHSWPDFVQVVKSVVCVLQCDGRPSRSVVQPVHSTAGLASTPKDSLLASSAALLVYVSSLSEALYHHLTELDMIRFCGCALRRYLAVLSKQHAHRRQTSESTPEEARRVDDARAPTASEEDLVVVLKCTELVIAISHRETLTEWQSADEKAAWESMFASILQVRRARAHTCTRRGATAQCVSHMCADACRSKR